MESVNSYGYLEIMLTENRLITTLAKQADETMFSLFKTASRP